MLFLILREKVNDVEKMSQKKSQREDIYEKMKVTVEMKCEIMAKRDGCVSVADLARTYNRYASTVCIILKKKNKFMDEDVS